MKRILLLTTLAAMLAASLALSGVAFATHSQTNNDGGQNRDFASGSGKLAQPFAAFQEVSLGASSGPSGENPQGFINVRNADFGPPFDGKGHVVCLSVRDNRAVAVAEFKEDSPFPGFPYALIIVEDNGGPDSTIPDRAWATGIAIDPEQITLEETCNLYLEAAQFLPLEPLVSGNLIVHDATPQPPGQEVEFGGRGIEAPTPFLVLNPGPDEPECPRWMPSPGSGLCTLLHDWMDMRVHGKKDTFWKEAEYRRV